MRDCADLLLFCFPTSAREASARLFDALAKWTGAIPGRELLLEESIDHAQSWQVEGISAARLTYRNPRSFHTRDFGYGIEPAIA